MTPPLSSRCDVLVIGGGMAGFSVAWHLSAHASVVLVETERLIGLHSTGRSAAMLNVTSGPPAVCRLASAGREFLSSPPDGFCDAPLLGPRGLLWVGRSGTEEMLEATRAKAPNGAAQRLGPVDAHRLVPLLADEAASAGGVLEPGAMSIDVSALLEGYRRGLLGRGGLVHVSSEVIELRRAAGVWTVTAGESTFTCATVVNAAGAWADTVARRAGLKPLGLRPLRRTAVLVSAPSAVRDWPMVMDVEGRWYACPDSGGLLISPADESPSEPEDARPDEADVALAIERVNAALDLGIRSVRQSWVGLRTFTSDRLPAIGSDPQEPSFVWLVGQGGAGIKMAPELARLVADALNRGAEIPADLDVARFDR
jgi:D-arginine dehydrogenase